MGTIASQITSLTSVYSTVYSGADQSKHQSSPSLAFVWGIHRGPVNSPHKWPVTRKMFPFDDVIMKMGVLAFSPFYFSYWYKTWNTTMYEPFFDSVIAIGAKTNVTEYDSSLHHFGLWITYDGENAIYHVKMAVDLKFTFLLSRTSSSRDCNDGTFMSVMASQITQPTIAC